MSLSDGYLAEQASLQPRGPLRDVEAVTPAELRVIEAFSHGLNGDMVAELLGVSPHTIRGHVASVRAKLAAKTVAQCVAVLLRAGKIR